MPVAGGLRVKEKRAATVAGGAATVREFDPKAADAFDLWCRARAKALVAANRSLKDAPWSKAHR